MSPIPASIDALPALNLCERKRLPECAAIYFVRSDDGTVLYIGRARNLRQRWAQHHRTAQLMTYPGVSLAWLSVDDPALLDEIERACIAYFSPLLNGTESHSPVRKRELTITLSRRAWAIYQERLRQSGLAGSRGAASEIISEIIIASAAPRPLRPPPVVEDDVEGFD